MRHELKRKRLAILKQINELEPTRCSFCKNTRAEGKYLMCKCPANVKILELGKLYQNPDGTKPDGIEYDPDMVELAKANNIDFKTFRVRVRKLGWTQLDAATKPIRPKGVKV